MDYLSMFAALSPTGKAMVLARLAHMETIHVRNVFSHPTFDAEAVGRSNELIHRVSGYAVQVLSRQTSEEQDRSVMGMIVEAVRPRGNQYLLELGRWLQQANEKVT